MSSIHPIQPFFVVNAKEYYKRLSPHTVISHYYKFSGQPGTSACCAVPDGAIDIIFLCDGERPHAVVCGSVSQVMRAGFEDNATYFGVRLVPGLFDRIGPVTTGEIMRCHYDADEVMGSALAERIAAEPDFARQIDLFESAFLQSVSAGDSAAHQVARSVLHGIYASAGTVRVQELETELHYSRRHLCRCFESAMGVDIKQYAGFVRFQAVLKRMNAGEFQTVCQATAAGQYYDQAHFQKDFKRFTNTTPRAYLALLKQVHYTEKMTVC